ncbi:cupin domain-containing protein [Methylophaga sp. OBS4]|uniref:cupin domain-containing protein n=1 Tax=Methylophaga sp. OBS4 TaxID=2991935 RepID=UPI00225A0D96|nr:cupin domain-containing protein [Methylophaga sp. OBS4]MCX4187706.1 cupin domain-containing protein [Methylophaga sp. OBS4]
MNNIFSSLPSNLEDEVFEDIVNGKNIRIERIISHGHASPEQGWYDQDENEWVIVLSGSGSLLFDNGDQFVLSKGDYINIPAHTRHKVLSTAPDEPTIWLAVFYS